MHCCDKFDQNTLIWKKWTLYWFAEVEHVLKQIGWLFHYYLNMKNQPSETTSFLSIDGWLTSHVFQSGSGGVMIDVCLIMSSAVI